VANILLRGLDDEVVTRLKAEAAAGGQSMQAHIREILTAASVRSMAATRKLSTRWLAELAAANRQTPG